MKKEIHPKYFETATVRCACGNTFTVGSTKEYLEVEVCPKCHPFYTGKEKIMDTMGQIQKFNKKMETKQADFVSKKAKKAAKKEDKKKSKNG